MQREGRVLLSTGRWSSIVIGFNLILPVCDTAYMANKGDGCRSFIIESIQ